MAEFTKFDMRMFEKAHEIAATSDFDHFKMGCVITYKHHIISVACNSNKTHPAQSYYNKYRDFRKNGPKPCVHSVHAEIAALSKIPYPIAQQIDWKQVNVYVYRIAPGLRLGKGSARCCPACAQALRDKGIRNIYYSTDYGFAFERLD